MMKEEKVLSDNSYKFVVFSGLPKCINTFTHNPKLQVFLTALHQYIKNYYLTGEVFFVNNNHIEITLCKNFLYQSQTFTSFLLKNTNKSIFKEIDISPVENFLGLYLAI